MLSNEQAATRDDRSDFERTYEEFKKARQAARTLQSAVNKQADKIVEEQKHLGILEKEHQKSRKRVEELRALLMPMLDKDISNW